jgi:anti-sigma regulatory factor (Ser/Thr protein kinase)
VQITVVAQAAQDHLQVTVTDTGTWRPPHGQLDTRGHGILFMHALMDEVTINTTEHGTTVTMTKEL